MNTKTKPAAQLSLELILERNKTEADRLLSENARIETEMRRILNESAASPPSSRLTAPSSRLVEAFRESIPRHKNGDTLELMATEMAPTLPPVSKRIAAERDVVYAAVAMVRSWTRRHKKNFKNQERELVNAVEKLQWEK